MDSVNQIEIHYSLPGGEHAANAFAIAKAETEFIHMVREVGGLLEIEFELQAQALKEGGIRQIWRALGKNSPQVGVLLSIVAIVISLKPQGDRELVELQKEEARLHIAALKRQLSENAPSVSEATANGVAKEIGTDLKVVRRKSNFYQALLAEPKIAAVSYSLGRDGSVVEEVGSAQRAEFADFIRLTGDLPSERDDDAVIGIISPVLKKGRFKWKGEYKGEYIEFWLQDKAFKESVLSKTIQFHSGTAIHCVLEIKITVDEVGCLTRSGYYVKVVKKVVDEGFEFQTDSGKRYLDRKDAESRQLPLL